MTRTTAAPGLSAASIEAATNTTRWYFTDHLGTPLLQTDTTAAAVWRAEQAPYGSIFSYRAGATLHQPLRFPGQIAQDTGDVSYNIFRWYRSWWGKYTQPDPVGLKAGANLYQYGNDNPGIYIDPLGTTKCKSGSCADCPGGVWVGTAGVAEAGVKFFGVGIGKVIFAGVLLCTSNLYLSVPFVTECTFFGGPMKKGIGVIAPEVGGAVVGCKGMKCKEDLAGPEEGVYGQAGPVYGFGEGTKTGGCVGFGAAEAGLYGGGFKCKTYIKE